MIGDLFEKELSIDRYLNPFEKVSKKKHRVSRSGVMPSPM
jgi:hypothetical protein